MRSSQSSRAPYGAARGQALILTVLLMLVVVVTVFLTFAIGARTRRKIQLQAVADSTAYSLAVAEARAFNFYAWSNRAIVAHNVSILSVHAHTSYLTFYEDMLGATANNFRIMSQRAGGDVAEALDHIADIYLNSTIDLDTSRNCTMRRLPDGTWQCRVDLDCSGAEDCDLNYNRRRGALFFHEQWHTKANSNTCHMLVDGSRDHFRKVELLRAHQLGVDAQLKLMMTGHRRDMMPSEDRPLIKASTRKDNRDDYYGDLERKILDLPERSLAQQLVMLTDTNLTAQDSAGYVSLDYYQKAVDNGLRSNLHKEYDEILAGTRYGNEDNPHFITERGFKEDINWRRLASYARRVSRGVGTPASEVFNEGTTRMLKVGSTREDSGNTNEHDPLDGVWPPVYSNMPTPPVGQANPPYVLPRSGRVLARQVHREGHDSVGYGDSDGLASEDHGWVESTFTLPSGAVMRQRTQIEPGRNTVWADPHDYRGLDVHDFPGDNITHSNHIFHANLMRVPGHGTGLGGCDDTGCDGDQRGLYRGHMRFKLASLQNVGDLWNLPRTMTLITRPARERNWPWDFDFRAEIPGPFQFTTIHSDGDIESDVIMAAIAGGLVYFHKPANSGEEYREPPNLWNPFWRAKLHPMKQADAVTATENAHRPTYRILLELDRWSAVNY
jgi:hypothetical protein